MKRIIILLSVAIFILSGFDAFGQQADELLKKAKKEGKILIKGIPIQPRKKGDDEKYVRITNANGEQWVDRGAIALDLFEKAADAGSGEAAYILFCYHCLGRYEGEKFASMDPKYIGKDNWDWHILIGEKFFQRAVDLNYPDAMEYYVVQKEGSYDDKKKLVEDWREIYDALNGDPLAQYNLAERYKDSNPVKYEYWIKKSLSHKNWPLLARAMYANWLLDNGRSRDAKKIMEPAVKRNDYMGDNMARFGFLEWSRFLVAERVYEGDETGAIEYCDKFYNIEISPSKDLDRYYKLHDANFLEYCVSYYDSPERKRLFEEVYKMTPNPTDSLILYNRGRTYEAWGDSIKAFDNYRKAALGRHSGAINKMFDYASRGYVPEEKDLNEVLSEVIKKEDPVTGDFMIPGSYANWRTYYVLGEYFYNSAKDYRKALRLYYGCMDELGCPQVVKGACARQIFKCYEFGRGVETDHIEAEGWLKRAEEIGDEDIKGLYDALYPKEE
ncbi:MAG: hypothetical protein K2N05_12735 [Muribaculaceae bacterium]|nr:hypothetical protein [Muribaculaceae bacterium]